MADDIWRTKRLSIVSLALDRKNPRLGRESLLSSPREITQYLFDHDKVIEVATSIAIRGYFPNEPLLAVKEAGKFVVVEGNRRLAALKALRQPSLLVGAHRKAIERLIRRASDLQDLGKVPVTIAPNRRATDRQVAGRHVGSAVLPWEAENRASFILEKLAEGYDNDQVRDELGFTLADIQRARQTRAIADMARSLEFPEEVKAKIDSPRAKLFTTIERVFDSSVGKKFFMVQGDPDHGLRGATTSKEFILGFTKLVTDVALGKQSSRSLNKNEDIEAYLEAWDPSEKPRKKRGSFVPSDVIIGHSIASPISSGAPRKKARQKPINKTVLPRSLKVETGHDRLVEIRNELVKLKTETFPNAGAVLLRVFLELTVIDYLERTGELSKVKAKLQGKGDKEIGTPNIRSLVPAITRIAKDHLTADEGKRVEKALRYDRAAPFSLSDLHSFVHQSSEFPGERDIKQFWNRTEPLFRLMLAKQEEKE